MKSTRPTTGKFVDELLSEHFRELREEDEEIDLRISRVLAYLGPELHEIPFELKERTRTAPVRWLPKLAFLAVVTMLVVISVTVWSRQAHFSPATVEAVGAGLQVIGKDGVESIQVGAPISFGEVIHSQTGEGATFVTADGSRVEMRPNSRLSLERASDGLRIRLNDGSVIVTAAKQRDGHLYVQTRDLFVSVVGTAFLVNAEEAGSRVSVLQGRVKVQQGSRSRTLVPGDQMGSNPLLNLHALNSELSWSRHAGEHLALLKQSAVTAPEPTVMEFEAASLRRLETGIPTQVRCRGIDGELAPASATAAPVPLGRCIGSSVSVRALAAAAYDIDEQHISDATDSATEDFYRLDAVAMNPSTVTTKQLRQMLQSLLNNRFSFRFHRETKEAQGYVIRIAAEGAKFKETEGDEERPQGRLVGSPLVLTQAEPQERLTIFKGRFRLRRLVESWSLLLRSAPMLDKTDLGGIYDINLTLALTSEIIPPSPNAGPQPVRATTTIEPRVLVNALQEQLGLRLESARVPVESLVIDHFGRASDN